MTWGMRQAGANFEELLDASLHHGPQVVERDGEAMAVLVPMGE
jgi:antitoxin Phd